MAAAGAPWRELPDGLSVAVRLTPRGGRDSIDGVATLSDGRAVLSARVRAAPEDGKANAALLRLLAAVCDVPTRAVTLSAGATARLKTITVRGEPAALARGLQRSVQATERPHG